MEDGLTECLNCGAILSGEFCAACGQRDLPPEPHLRELAAEAWDAFVSVDGKVAQTLRLLLTKPGEMTAIYLTGKRARFIPPLRLYLLCSVVFFVVSASAPARTGAKAAAANKAYVDSALSTKEKRVDDSTFARQLAAIDTMHENWLWKRFKRNGMRVGRDGKNFTADFKEQFPRVMFVAMPAFALLLALVYRRRRRPYATHLVVSVHLHAFAFATMALGQIALWMPLREFRQLAGWVVALWLVIYFPLALRRIYGGRLVPAIGRTMVLGTLYGVVVTAVMGVVALLLVFFY